MKKIVIWIVLIFGLKADYYMAQIEPYQTHSVSTEVGGIVQKIALDREFSYIDNRILVVGLDTSDEDIAISYLSKKVDALKEALELSRNNLKSKANISQTSKYELNRETLSVLNSKQALISTEMELQLKKNRKDKKLFYLKDGYLGKIYVDEFEFVAPGQKLFDYYDFYKSRLDIFVTSDEVDNIRDKRIFINGEETKTWRVEKVSKVKDSKRISTYQVRLVKENREPKDSRFGEIVKVEFK